MRDGDEALVAVAGGHVKSRGTKGRPDPAPLSTPAAPAPPLRHRSAKADALLVGVALFAVLCGAAVLKFRTHPALVVAIDSTTEVTVGSASTVAPVALTSTSESAVLVGTATPGAAVRVLDHQAVADDNGAWRITVVLVPGVNHFQAVATAPSGEQVATNFTVVYTPSATTDLVASPTTSRTSPTVTTTRPTTSTTATTRPATTVPVTTVPVTSAPPPPTTTIPVDTEPPPP